MSGGLSELSKIWLWGHVTGFTVHGDWSSHSSFTNIVLILERWPRTGAVLAESPSSVPSTTSDWGLTAAYHLTAADLMPSSERL